MFSFFLFLAKFAYHNPKRKTGRMPGGGKRMEVLKAVFWYGWMISLFPILAAVHQKERDTLDNRVLAISTCIFAGCWIGLIIIRFVL